MVIQYHTYLQYGTVEVSKRGWLCQILGEEGIISFEYSPRYFESTTVHYYVLCNPLNIFLHFSKKIMMRKYFRAQKGYSTDYFFRRKQRCALDSRRKILVVVVLLLLVLLLVPKRHHELIQHQDRSTLIDR